MSLPGSRNISAGIDRPPSLMMDTKLGRCLLTARWRRYSNIDCHWVPEAPEVYELVIRIKRCSDPAWEYVILAPGKVALLDPLRHCSWITQDLI
jgi:hypothetical protein